MANLGARSIRARDVLYYLQDSHARRRVLILDCCQSGAIGREFRGDDLQSSLAGLADSFGSYILTASTAIQLAEEREKDGHGVFTKALIDCLREGRKDRITLTDLYDYAYARLKITAKQTPRLWTIEQEGTPIEIANYVAKHQLQKQKAAEELISKAKIKFDALHVSRVLTEGQVESVLRLLECDDARLFPHDQEFRKNVIRYLDGEIDFVTAFAAAPFPQISAAYSVVGHASGWARNFFRSLRRAAHRSVSGPKPEAPTQTSSVTQPIANPLITPTVLKKPKKVISTVLLSVACFVTGLALYDRSKSSTGNALFGVILLFFGVLSSLFGTYNSTIMAWRYRARIIESLMYSIIAIVSLSI